MFTLNRLPKKSALSTESPQMFLLVNTRVGRSEALQNNLYLWHAQLHSLRELCASCRVRAEHDGTGSAALEDHREEDGCDGARWASAVPPAPRRLERG